jgi:hypothetical protein
VICVLTHRHDPDRPRPALGGWLVCWACATDLRRVLTLMPPLYRELAGRLAVTGTGGAPVTGSSSIPLPLNLAAAAARYTMDTTLQDWTRPHVAGQHLHRPTATSTDILAPWLLRHLDWAYSRDWVADYATALRMIRHDALGVLYPAGTRRYPVGPCEQADCTGTITAIIRASDNLAPSALVCLTCGWDLPASDWLAFGLALCEKRDPHPMETAS